MAIEIISGEVAWGNVTSNKLSKWPSKINSNRLYPIAKPIIAPKFKIHKGEKVFCIGSCFAREVEQALKRIGFDVLSIVRNLPRSSERQVADAGMFNKYTIPSILNELFWALDCESGYSSEKILIENSSGLYEDYQLSGSNYADKLAEATIFRDAFKKSFSAILDADVVVITLGLSEAWFDKSTNLYLNVAPTRNLVKKFPGRFILKVLDYAGSLEMLELCYQLLLKYLKPDFKLLITVSPVPLNATFRAQDVMIANSYSKALLRSVVEKFQHDKLNVNYFPSYEFVTLSYPEIVWGDDDFRHVHRFFVDNIMTSVLDIFCESNSIMQEMSLLAQSTVLYRGGFMVEAEILLREKLIDLSSVENPKLILRWAMINHKLKNLELSRLAYLEYLIRCPDDEKIKTKLNNLNKLV